MSPSWAFFSIRIDDTTAVAASVVASTVVPQVTPAKLRKQKTHGLTRRALMALNTKFVLFSHSVSVFSSVLSSNSLRLFVCTIHRATTKMATPQSAKGNEKKNGTEKIENYITVRTPSRSLPFYRTQERD